MTDFRGNSAPSLEEQAAARKGAGVVIGVDGGIREAFGQDLLRFLDVRCGWEPQTLAFHRLAAPAAALNGPQGQEAVRQILALRQELGIRDVLTVRVVPDKWNQSVPAVTHEKQESGMHLLTIPVRLLRRGQEDRLTRSLRDALQSVKKTQTKKKLSLRRPRP